MSLGTGQVRMPRVYPWGNEFDKEKCNTNESGIGHATPVKKYQEGRSAYGCLNMTGNACEWTDSWYVDKKEKAKVLRGCSWFDYQSHVRCSNRTGLNLVFRLSYMVGFCCARTL